MSENTNPFGVSDAELNALRRLKAVARTPEESGGHSRPDIDALSTFERCDGEENYPLSCRHVRAARPDQVQYAVRAIENMVEWRKDRIRGRYRLGGVVLSGKAGRGKTALATYLAFYGAYLGGLKSSYVSCQAMLRHLRGGLDARVMQYSDYLRKVEPADWQAVTLDDLGAEAPPTGASNTEARDAARDVIDICSASCMYLVITTNKSAGDLARYLTERWASRASQLSWIEFANEIPDLRKELP